MAATTAFILALFVVIVTGIWMAADSEGTHVTIALAAATIFVVGIALYAYAYAPNAFHLEPGAVRIERPAGNITIPLASISNVQPFDTFLGLSRKSMPGGNSGLFGIYGTFHRRELGKFQLYSRRANATVLL